MQGILKNSTPNLLHVWTPPPDVLLPAVVGRSWSRVNEWLEEVGYIREGVKLISGGTGFSFTQVVQSQDADGAAYASSITETALATTVTFLGSAAGTVSGGFFSANKALQLHFRGIMSTTGTPNWTTNVRIDSTTGSSLGAQTLYATGSGISNLPFGVDATVVCRADSTAGILECFTEYLNGGTGGTASQHQLNRANITSVDTTANHSFLVTGLWGTSSASNTATAKIFIVEVLN